MSDASTNLKPFQGLKRKAGKLPDTVTSGGFNQPKTLSGIETISNARNSQQFPIRFNQPKTLSGIETRRSAGSDRVN